jgi:poly(hydroxyalkanoate) granule-associated protein
LHRKVQPPNILNFHYFSEHSMVKKLQKNKSSKAELKGKVKDSAQQIWQAGLGAFTKAQAEGAKAIETLVKDSVSIQRKTKAAAEEKISEATSKMTNMATDISSKASGQWDKLENIFEERVAKALNKLGVPSAKDVNALIARIDDLNKAVQKLSAKAPVVKAAPVKAAAPKAVAPKTAAPKAKPAAPKAAPKAATKRAAPAKKAEPAVVAETAPAQA